jgi:1-acyl-sn-glycerol-3-phosphate acyltransferase
MPPASELDERWSRTAVAARVREFLVCGVLGPCMDLYTRRRVRGRDRLKRLDGPAVLVANHASHMDTPALLRALPGKRRRRTAVAAAVDYFYAKRRNAVAASLVFGTVPVDRDGGGLSQDATGHLREWVDSGGTLLMFAEGTRTNDSKVGRLKSGAAVLAAQQGVPLVPVYVDGTSQAMPRGHHWMVFRHGRPWGARHPIEIAFGEPMHPREGEEPAQLMERVRLFLAESGAATEPDPRAAREPERV